MALKNIRNEIERFLASSTPEVLCIKGKWGVGKTFAWNTFLQEAQNNKKVALQKYAYTSLFGLKSLDDLKYSIFENTLDFKNDVSKSDQSSKLDWLPKNYKKILTALSDTGLAQQYIGSSRHVLFYLVREQIICIDDFERAGSGLEPIEILGLISFLKEQRQCKVVFLLNDEELKDEVKDIFEKQLEKVSDTVLSFLPKPLESAGIVYPLPQDDTTKLLHDFSVQLGIVNIRVIKKIEALVKRLIEIVGVKYPGLVHQMAHSATLFGWSHYEPSISPPLEYYKNSTRIMGLLHGKEKLTEKEEQWNSVIKSYNFQICDDFDLVIMKGIMDGYFDEDELMKEADKLNTMKMKQEQDGSLKKAWEKYHYSFADNEEEVITDIYTTATKTINVISPINLNAIIKFLKEFKKEDQAKELLNKYIDTHSGNKESFKLNSAAFFGEDIDYDLKTAFDAKARTFESKRELSEVLISISENRAWGEEETAFLAEKTSDEFYTIFKEAEGEGFRNIVIGALMFRSIGNPTEDMKKVTANVMEALKQIAKENRLNERRVRSYGVEIGK